MESATSLSAMVMRGTSQDSISSSSSRRELDAIYGEQKISTTLRIMVPLFLAMVTITITVSSVNLLICWSNVIKGTIEAGYVRDSYARVGLTAQSRNLIRTLLNVANNVEPGTSPLTNDRVKLNKMKLNDTAETLREYQNRLNLADF